MDFRNTLGNISHHVVSELISRVLSYEKYIQSLYVNIDEFTRYGQMILHKGNYNGKQLVPESYMKMATSNLVDNSVAGSPGNLYSGFGYGYQFVMNPEAGSYRSDGNYGQFCLAFPDKDAVVTVMSLEGDFQKIGNHLWTTVVPEL